MSIAENDNFVEDPATSLEYEVEHAVRMTWLCAKELEGYRRHNGARPILQRQMLMDDIETARDQLSRLLDDVRGVQ